MRAAARRLGIAAAILLVDLAATDRAAACKGVHLRLGGGLAYVSSASEGDAIPLVGLREATIGGVGAAGELAIGGHLTPSLVLGAGVDTQLVPSPKAQDATIAAGRVNVGDIGVDATWVTLFGPMVDGYLAQTSGFHVQASVGVTHLSLGRGRSDVTGLDYIDAMSGVGPGAMVGVGHEWSLAEHWSAGILARFTVAHLGTDDRVPSD